MPPAVEPGLPPINISIIVRSLPESDMEATSTTLNPAVLGVIAQNKDAMIFCGIVMPASVLSYSNAYMSNVPMTIRMAVAESTILVCNSYFLKLNLCFETSSHTKNPIPPITISADMVRLTMASVENEVNDEYAPLHPMISKPALQKAETE
ncbi:hypothetical protein SDC9_195865 [bioreactor metagenome]|uniref:Uncharacterized protein n=1 Tax=bioreactor metagenome TaxID=1076179 RepID=A0A645ICS8_9ZZZZ